MKNRSWRVVVSADEAGEEPGSQPPQAQTTASASSRVAAVHCRRRLAGVARGRGRTRAPCARACAASVWDRLLGAQHAGLGLVEQERRGRRRGSSGTAARPRRAQPLDRDVLRAHRRLRGGLPAVVAVREPDRGRTRSAGRRRTRPRARATACARGGRRRCSRRRSPWPQRIRRVSPPEVARRSPGSNWSTSVTCTPSRASHHASEAPNVPAPTITIESMAVRTLPCRGCSPWLPPPRRSCSATPRRTARCAPSGSARGRSRCSSSARSTATRRPGARCSRGCATSMPPDGRRAVARRLRQPRRRARAGTRQNARGIDLNRNFGRRWAAGGRPFDTYYPGGAPSQSPSRAPCGGSSNRLHPAVTVWYHQHMRLVNLSSGADPRVVRAYARRVGLPRAHAAELPRHRHELAEPHVPRHELLRGRAARRPAQRRLLAPPRPRGARRRAASPPPARRRAPPHRLAQDPVRRDPPRPDARLREAPLRHVDRDAAPEGDRRALHGLLDVLLGLQHVRLQRRPTSSCTSARACARTSSSTRTGRSTSSSR